MNLYIIWKNVKKTAEISWLFFSDVKISKKSIKENFGIFYCNVKTYLNPGSPSTQCEISCIPDIHSLLSVLIFKRKILDWIFQLILHLWIQIWIMAIGIWIWPNNKTAKLDYLPKPKKSKKKKLLWHWLKLNCGRS